MQTQNPENTNGFTLSHAGCEMRSMFAEFADLFNLVTENIIGKQSKTRADSYASRINNMLECFGDYGENMHEQNKALGFAAENMQSAFIKMRKLSGFLAIADYNICVNNAAKLELQKTFKCADSIIGHVSSFDYWAQKQIAADNADNAKRLIEFVFIAESESINALGDAGIIYSVLAEFARALLLVQAESEIYYAEYI